MRGYLSLANADGTRVPVDDQVEIYRVEERDQQVVADLGDRTVDLGVADPTVSRKKDTAPVEVVARSEFIEVRNNGNANRVAVVPKADGGERTVKKGAVETVRRDTIIEIGYQTRLELVVERAAREVTRVEHEGEGDVVVGDQIDQRTVVEDAVINRSNIGSGSSPDGVSGAPGGTSIEDTVVNRSNVGTGSSHEEPPDRVSGAGSGDAENTDTRGFCETHERTYEGDRCPLCAGGTPHGPSVNNATAVEEPTFGDATGDGPVEGGASGDTGAGRNSTDGDRETKYCIYCGENIPAPAVHCPDCGERQPE